MITLDFVTNLGSLFFKLFKLSLISYFIFFAVEISSHHLEESDFVELKKVILGLQNRNSELVSKVEKLNAKILELQSKLHSSKVDHN